MGCMQGTPSLWETPLLPSRGYERSCIVRTMDYSILQVLCQLRGFALSKEERKTLRNGTWMNRGFPCLRSIIFGKVSLVISSKAQKPVYTDWPQLQLPCHRANNACCGSAPICLRLAHGPDGVRPVACQSIHAVEPSKTPVFGTALQGHTSVITACRP